MKGLGIKLLFCVAGLIGLQTWNFFTQNFSQKSSLADIQQIKEVKLAEAALYNDFLYHLKSINELYGTAILLNEIDLILENTKNAKPLKQKVIQLQKKYSLKPHNSPLSLDFLNEIHLYLDQAESTYINFLDSPNDPDFEKATYDIGQLYQKITTNLENLISSSQSDLHLALNQFQENSSKSHFISSIINIISIAILVVFGFFVHDSLVTRLKKLLNYLNNLSKKEEIPNHKTRNDEIGLIENQIIKVQQDLLQAKQNAEKAHQAKAEFLANMNHELRTPLNGIMGMTEYLQQSELDPMQKQCINTIDRSSHLLLDILSDILEMSKLSKEQISLAPQPTSIATVFEHMEKVLHPALQKKGNQLSLKFEIEDSIPEEIWIDSKQLNKLLLYLIGNAIKFSDSGVIQVKAKLLQPTEPEYYLLISIEDQGIGIAPEQLNRLFDAFTQADESSTRNHGGTGLGLALSKATVKLMKGQLGVESKEGVGSTF